MCTLSHYTVFVRGLLSHLVNRSQGARSGATNLRNNIFLLRSGDLNSTCRTVLKDEDVAHSDCVFGDIIERVPPDMNALADKAVYKAHLDWHNGGEDLGLLAEIGSKLLSELFDIFEVWKIPTDPTALAERREGMTGKCYIHKCQCQVIKKLPEAIKDSHLGHGCVAGITCVDWPHT